MRSSLPFGRQHATDQVGMAPGHRGVTGQMGGRARRDTNITELPKVSELGVPGRVGLVFPRIEGGHRTTEGTLTYRQALRFLEILSCWVSLRKNILLALFLDLLCFV